MKRAILIFAAALALGACSATITRPEVHQRQASYTATGQDSGIADETNESKAGFSVNQDWLDGYDSLLMKYGNKLTPPRKGFDRNGITKEGDHYRITDAVMERQQVLNQRRVDEQGP